MEPEDAELEKLMSMRSPFITDQYLFDIGSKIFPMSLDEFYDTFLAVHAPMNFINYYLANKLYKDIRLENYKRDEGLSYEEYHINMIIPISGVPFCK